jgi:hypothetical protein
MGNRALLGAALVMSGTLCIAVALIVAAWLDTCYAHENTALTQAAMQAALQGKTINVGTPHVSVIAPPVIWCGFALGGGLILVGLLVGLRGLPPAIRLT